MTTLIELATDLIAVFEGCKLTAYKDSGGVWTIGIGHTGPDVVEGLTITPIQAQALFLKDQAHLINATIPYTSFPTSKSAALISFGYNCGLSKMLAVIAGTDSILNPVHQTDRHGNVLPGLVSRRNLENSLYNL